jgi:hypothetical protein
MVQPGTSHLLDALKKQDSIFHKVRQTADAALDSRFLVNASELAGKKLNTSLQGNAGVGIDLDQFVSKCIFFMKSGGQIADDEDAPAVAVPEDEDDAGDEGLDESGLLRRRPGPSDNRLDPPFDRRRSRRATSSRLKTRTSRTWSKASIRDYGVTSRTWTTKSTMSCQKFPKPRSTKKTSLLQQDGIEQRWLPPRSWPSISSTSR